MAKIQCKMCGGALDLPDDVTVGKCPWCGSMTTFSKITSDHVEQLYSRAEHYRHAGDFDKAMSAYEAIVRETPDDAEAYWGLVLSRFGIEYVEDPVTHERIPTCHRVQYESILADGDYQSALEHASDQGTRDMYEAEATRIAKIQKDILAISSQEKPFDVFICYKETTDGGSRTKDSMDAQEIYYQLTNVGYKVFFSRITLEDKLGQQYEPYIFAALNSAKVMLVIGSKKEYFNAVWVKNEWSRFLSLMKKDRSKLLIPCYKDMDVYDLPEELSMLQSQDMSKIGFMQDLVRGCEKVMGNKDGKKSEYNPQNIEKSPLLKRIQLFLKSGDFNEAKQYCERVLDQDPENAEAYLYRLMAENSIMSESELYLSENFLTSQKTFALLMQFAKTELKSKINEQVQKQVYRISKNYIDSLDLKDISLNFKKYFENDVTSDYSIINIYKCLIEISNAIKSISEYGGIDEIICKCNLLIEKICEQTQQYYLSLCQEVKQKIDNGSISDEEYAYYMATFDKITDFLPDVINKDNHDTNKIKNLIKHSRYQQAMSLLENKEYKKAWQIYKSLGDYQDSVDKIIICEQGFKKAVEQKNAVIFAIIASIIFFILMFVLGILP